jgi:hypothetical protein
MAKNKRRSNDSKSSTARPERQTAAKSTDSLPTEATAARPARNPVFLMAATLLLASWLLFLVAMAVAN